MSAETSQRKDFWDKLQVIGSPLIAAVGVLFTIIYSTKQDEWKARQMAVDQLRQDYAVREHARIEQAQLTLQRLDAVGKFYQDLTGPDNNRRALAINMIKNAGDDLLATRLGGQLDPATLDSLFARPAAAPPALPATLTARAPQSRTGWAYLGDYDASKGRWTTHYLDFSLNALPASLQGARLAVASQTGALNIRSGMPTTAGEFPTVIDVLPPGATVRIRSVSPWTDSSYQWASVEYVK
jgi:hypothetical protein